MRIQIDVSEKLKARIVSLMEKSESVSLSETIRKALALYECVIENTSLGGKLLVQDHEGKTKEVVVRW